MKLIEHFLTDNPCYKEGRKLDIKGIMLHSVGCAVSEASYFTARWNDSSFNKACVHCFIDANSGTVIQTLPWDYRAPHCGAGPNGSANNTHISIEMCEPPCIEYSCGVPFRFVSSDSEVSAKYAQRTYDTAVELSAMLCVKFNLDPLEDGVIISHEEGYFRGIASNHADPAHIWKCLDMEYTMDQFRADVKSRVDEALAHPCVALTFDDGPSAKTTPKILDLLAKYNATASFCVLGSRVAQHPDIINRMSSQNCEIINHSWNHEKLTDFTEDEITDSIRRTDDEIIKAANIRPFFFRPPYMADDDRMIDLIKSLNKSELFWNQDPRDWELRDAEKIASKVLDNVWDGNVIIMHDIYESTYEAAAIIIPELIKRGYEITTVSRMLEQKRIPLTEGQRYFSNK